MSGSTLCDGATSTGMANSPEREKPAARFLGKCAVTLILAIVLVVLLMNWEPSYGSAFVMPFFCVVIGIVISALWTPAITRFVFKPLTSLFDGGNEEIEPKPMYSIAEAKRKKGLYHEALWEVQSQLARFPHDLAAQLMMAEIQALDLQDLEGAALTVHRLCAQKCHPPAAIAGALNQLADWRLKLAQDTEGARSALEEVIARLPDSPWAHAALQRVAHLASPDKLLEAHDRRPIHMAPSVQDLGLQKGPSAPPPGPSGGERTQELVRHLTEFPDDDESREELAILYARHYARLDLAVLELEQLISQSHISPKVVARWLNLLADFQLQLAGDEDAARAALQRIIDTFPSHSVAEIARQRQSVLKLELRKREACRVVKMGHPPNEPGEFPRQETES